MGCRFFLRGSSQLGDRMHLSYVSCLAGGFFTTSGTWEALLKYKSFLNKGWLFVLIADIRSVTTDQGEWARPLWVSTLAAAWNHRDSIIEYRCPGGSSPQRLSVVKPGHSDMKELPRLLRYIVRAGKLGWSSSFQPFGIRD